MMWAIAKGVMHIIFKWCGPVQYGYDTMNHLGKDQIIDEHCYCLRCGKEFMNKRPQQKEAADG